MTLYVTVSARNLLQSKHFSRRNCTLATKIFLKYALLVKHTMFVELLPLTKDTGYEEWIEPVDMLRCEG
jgi:hypothetical protein